MDAGSEEIRTAPCVFKYNDIIAVCYVDEPLVFSRDDHQVDLVKRKLGRDLVLKYLDPPVSFFGIELTGKKDTV